MTQVILIGGGVRSGKSTFALERARELGPRRAFIATAQAYDDEMTDRIARHQDERGDDFLTIEEPLALPEAIASLRDVDVVVVDCLTLWLSNLLLIDASLAPILARVDDLIAALVQRSCHAIIVTNEVGMGVVPPSPLGRAFRDVSGIAHQRLAAIADEVDVAIMGAILRIHPGPVALARPLR